VKILICSILMVFSHNAALLSQTNLSGNINTTATKVTALGLNSVTVADRTGFAEDDYVLLIQMKGATIRLENETGYGSFYSMGNVGVYEFLIISSVVPGAGTTGEVFFTAPDIENYEVSGSVQLVKVPFYESATVVSELSCPPWDSISGTGGVLAFIVGGKLTLNADINVTGKGFIGGGISTGTGECVSVDLATRNLYAYSSGSPFAGYKGEGIASGGILGVTNFPVYPAFAKGKGPSATGGGGGNGKFAGGGGGSNIGAGGAGSREANPCADEGARGLGGRAIPGGSDTVLIMGGGGGASTYETGSVASPGGRGGGIVIIIAESLDGNGRSIRSDGQSVTPLSTTGNAGAGGGGAGGTLALSVGDYGTTNLTLSVRGGQGGTTPGLAVGGGGGGGGGGLIWTTGTTPVTVTRNFTFGTSGVGASPGLEGKYKNDFKINLSGFLFNFVRSSVTLSSVDSICFGLIPPVLSGTVPKGGKGPYLYEWQKSYDRSNWTPLSNAEFAYTPLPSETDTLWFRRVITDNSLPAITDFGNMVRINVIPLITDNVVGKDTILCYNQNPLELNHYNSGPGGGNGVYTYLWKKSTDNIDFTANADGANTGSAYDPPALTANTWYQRVVYSGGDRCVDNSNPVSITVLPLISANTITSATETICEGGLFANLTGSAPAGGDGSYSYRWISRTTSTSWGPASAVNTSSGYNPVETEFPGTREYRRVVFSGADDVCIDTTANSVQLIMHPAIAGNTISGDQTICSSSQPTLINGAVPSGGDGSYRYTWQDSSRLHSWLNIPGFVNSTSSTYLPATLTDSTSYRRIALSSACVDQSAVVKIFVHKPLADFAVTLLSGGADTSICRNATPHLLKGQLSSGGTDIPGDYAYSWSSSTDNFNWLPVAAAGTGPDYQPATLGVTTWYRRNVISGQCSTTSASIRVVVLPDIGNNILPADTKLCYGEIPPGIIGSPPSGGDGTYTYIWEESLNSGTSWTIAQGISTLKDYQPQALTVPVSYRRIVYTGPADCAESISPMTSVSIVPLPNPVDAGSAFTTFFDYGLLNAVPPVTYTSKGWSSTFGFIREPLEDSTWVTNLETGKNLFTWTVTNDICTLSDTVTLIYSSKGPNAFSPDNNGINDFFEIAGLEETENELVILNIKGSEIIRFTNYSSTTGYWDGKDRNGDDVPNGTYYYFLTITKPSNSTRGGFIVLKRVSNE
jgi:gliding motility-associated-like protein